MAFGDSLDLRFRITADGKEAQKETERVRKGIENVTSATKSQFSTAAIGAGAAGVAIVAAIALVAAEIKVAQALAVGMADTAEKIGTKSRKAFEEFQKGVVAADGTITALDRQISQTLLATMDRVKGAADRIFIDLLRVAGPALIVLLQKIGNVLIAIEPLANIVGKVLVINFIAAAAAVQTFIDVLKLLPEALASGSLTQFFAVLALGVPQFQENVRKIKKEIEGLKFAPATFDDKTGKAEAESKNRIRILEIELKAAKRIFDEETAAAERAFEQRAIGYEELSRRLIAAEEKLFTATHKVLEAEKKEAETGDLPEQQRALKLAEIREKELQALSNYNANVRKINDERFKNEQESTEALLQFYRDAFDAKQQLNRQLRDLAIEAREVQLETRRAVLATTQSGGADNLTSRRRALQEDAKLQIEAERLRHERFVNSIKDQREELISKAITGQDQLDITERFNNLEEEEQRRHFALLQQFREEAQRAIERADPFSVRSILGEDFANVLQNEGSVLQAFGALFTSTFDEMARSALNVRGIITAFTGALTSMLTQLILTGKGGAQAFKSLAAAIIAEVVVTSAIKSLQMIAKGVEYASEASAAFATGDIVAGTFWAIASGHAFKSAALYGAIAGGGAIAGVALAANAGGGSGAAGGGGNQQQSNKPQDFTVNRGGDQTGQLGVEPESLRVTFTKIGVAIENLDKKISSMRPEDVLTAGADRASDAIGRAVVSEARRSAEFTNDFGRLLAGPV
jgi:hypothetical protein